MGRNRKSDKKVSVSLKVDPIVLTKLKILNQVKEDHIKFNAFLGRILREYVESREPELKEIAKRYRDRVVK